MLQARQRRTQRRRYALRLLRREVHAAHEVLEAPTGLTPSYGPSQSRA
jgi:hypothetical protein